MEQLTFLNMINDQKRDLNFLIPNFKKMVEQFLRYLISKFSIFLNFEITLLKKPTDDFIKKFVGS